MQKVKWMANTNTTEWKQQAGRKEGKRDNIRVKWQHWSHFILNKFTQSQDKQKEESLPNCNIQQIETGFVRRHREFHLVIVIQQVNSN